jgi:hypothetical protein
VAGEHVLGRPRPDVPERRGAVERGDGDVAAVRREVDERDLPLLVNDETCRPVRVSQMNTGPQNDAAAGRRSLPSNDDTASRAGTSAA